MSLGWELDLSRGCHAWLRTGLPCSYWSGPCGSGFWPWPMDLLPGLALDVPHYSGLIWRSGLLCEPAYCHWAARFALLWCCGTGPLSARPLPPLALRSRWAAGHPPLGSRTCPGCFLAHMSLIRNVDWYYKGLRKKKKIKFRTWTYCLHIIY